MNMIDLAQCIGIDLMKVANDRKKSGYSDVNYNKVFNGVHVSKDTAKMILEDVMKKCNCEFNESNDTIPKLDKAAPWVTYVNELRKFFEFDQDVYVYYDDEKDPYTVTLYIDSDEKFRAAVDIVPNKVKFGNVTLTIKVKPGNRAENDSQDDMTAKFKKFLKDNPIVDSIESIDNKGFFDKFTFVSFKNEVVQYYDDNGADPHGLQFTLYQDIAKDLFVNTEEVRFTTTPR